MSTKEKGTFTPRDFELLVGAMSCSKAPIEVDYKKFAEMFEFKNPASAKATWNSLKKKLNKMSEGNAGETEGKAGGVKRKAADADDDAEHDVMAEEAAPAAKKTIKSPAKKGRKAPVKGKGEQAAAADDDEEMPMGDVKDEDDGKVEAEE
ncbi:hypothetical protein B0A55_03637 [Friedmanniomyces simplex]|uniref:Uncharacterized protein n=1 Tax=Friedmanniomyces simplex TaxID=329884 RepID=A0A4U0XK51_9PEZI|nr:hypothetical protein B0A55_03637 [Friedmanniomyces simplex]